MSPWLFGILKDGVVKEMNERSMQIVLSKGLVELNTHVKLLLTDC